MFEDITQLTERYVIYFVGYDKNISGGIDGAVTIKRDDFVDFRCWITHCTKAMGMLLGR